MTALAISGGLRLQALTAQQHLFWLQEQMAETEAALIQAEFVYDSTAAARTVSTPRLASAQLPAAESSAETLPRIAPFVD